MRVQQIFPGNRLLALAAIVALVGISAFRVTDRSSASNPLSPVKDSLASVQAFKEVYKVLVSPRCMNCHPAGDVPLQGDDSHPHAMLPKRGKDGKGLYAMKCANCHQPTNSPGLYSPPGNPKWALPPAAMKMVFEGKTARELAVQLMDVERNGHKTTADLIEHARDTLVKAGWNMGEGRKPPPLAYPDFVAAWDTWINTGGFAPPE